jgi:hypothetical protein
VEQEAACFAERLASACSRALGPILDGIVLHGSLALGDYAPGRSDVDLLAVVARPLSDEEFACLMDAIAAEATAPPAPADVRVVTRNVAASPTRAPEMEVAIEITPGKDTPFKVERGHPGERDLVIEFSLCRAIGRSLAGSAPASLIGDVPPAWVVDVGDAQLARWQAIGDDPRHAQFTVLTTCRIWRFAEEGRHCSKPSAARWALARDPSLMAGGRFDGRNRRRRRSASANPRPRPCRRDARSLKLPAARSLPALIDNRACATASSAARESRSRRSASVPG